MQKTFNTFFKLSDLDKLETLVDDLIKTSSGKNIFIYGTLYSNYQYKTILALAIRHDQISYITFFLKKFPQMLYLNDVHEMSPLEWAVNGGELKSYFAILNTFDEVRLNHFWRSKI